jgi:NitT/TauT family transport system substrate-binding protein
MILRTLALVLSLAAASSAAAQDRLKVAIGQIDAWANQMPTLGMQAGIFPEARNRAGEFRHAGRGRDAAGR